jgi:Tfp pilus assembly protein PilF
MAYLKAGDPARGRQNLEAALKMNPNLPEAQMARQIFANPQR